MKENEPIRSLNIKTSFKHDAKAGKYIIGCDVSDLASVVGDGAARSEGTTFANRIVGKFQVTGEYRMARILTPEQARQESAENMPTGTTPGMTAIIDMVPTSPNCNPEDFAAKLEAAIGQVTTDMQAPPRPPIDASSVQALARSARATPKGEPLVPGRGGDTGDSLREK